ncbi:MAG: GNAT family N-acetyltransferase [Ignavibacteriaceae bacterium]
MAFEYSTILNDRLEKELDITGSSSKVDLDDFKSINLYEISNVRENIKLKEEWKKLFLKSSNVTPFQSWEWNLAMINKFASSEKLKIIVGYNNKSEIIGLAPLKLKYCKFTGIKILEFIGTGPSDYLDFLVVEEYKYYFISALINLIKKSGDWTILNFNNLREDTKNLITSCLSFEVSQQDVCPCIYLPDSMKKYESEVHKRELKSIKRKLRKLLPQNRLEYIVKESPESLKEDVDIFIDLHQKRQNYKGERGHFYTNALKDLFHNKSKYLCEAGFLKIEMLKIDSQIAAINYMLVWNNIKYNFLSGMNPAFSKYKPGKILIYYMIEDAINKGCKVFDFMQGAEEYKYFWTNKEIQLYSAVHSKSKFCLFIWKNRLAIKKHLKRSSIIKRFYQIFFGV